MKYLIWLVLSVSVFAQPYQPTAVDTPSYSPSFIIGQDADNGWDVVSKAEFKDTVDIAWIYVVSNYDSLSAAITSIGTDTTRLIIDELTVWGKKDTIPQNITLEFVNNGAISFTDDSCFIYG